MRAGRVTAFQLLHRVVERRVEMTLVDLVPAERYAAAIAFQNGPATVSTYAWTAEL